MSAVYLDQLTSCNVKSLLCHEAYHDAATVGPDEPGGLSVVRFGVVPVHRGRWPPGETTESEVGTAHASWAVMKM